MELQSITKALFEDRQALKEESRQLKTLAQKMAKADENYVKAFMTEVVRLKDGGFPATLCEKVADGKVAELRYEKILAKSLFEASKETVRALQQGTSALQSILNVQREI